MAPWIARDFFVSTVVGGLVLWAIWSGVQLFRAQRRVRAALDEATRLIDAVPDATSFAATFPQTDEALAGNALIGPSWRGFAHGLITPEQPGRPIVATTEPLPWFDLARLFRKSGADLRYHAALPGMLVGCGLLFTFLGLAAGLAAAGDVVAEHVTQSGRNAALHDLLGAASVKFITSLFGLLFSIFYALWRKHMLRQAERSLDRLMAALHRVLPFRSAAALQYETNRLLGQQFAEIQRIGTDFFVNLGATLEDKFSSGLEQHLAPLTAALDKLGDRLGGQNENAVESMLKAFLERLEGAAGNNMHQVAATLETLGKRLDGLQSGLDAAAGRMSAAAEAMTHGMGQGMKDALEGMSGQMASLIDGMRQAADEAGQRNRAAGDNLVRQIAEAAESLSRTIALLQTQFERGAAESIDRLAGPIEALLQQLALLTEQQRKAGQAAADDLASSLDRAAKALEAVAGRVGEGFGKSASDAGGKIAEATVTLGERLEAAAARLAVAGDAAGEALRAGGAEASLKLAEGGRVVAANGQLMADRLVALGSAATSLGDRAAALDAAAREAALPLRDAAIDLRMAAEASRQAAQPLAETAQSARLALDGLGRVASSMETAQNNAGALATRLGETTQRFAGLDQELGKTTDVMAQGIDEMARRLTAFVRDMDGGLAKNVGQLAALTKSLEEKLDDLLPA